MGVLSTSKILQNSIDTLEYNIIFHNGHKFIYGGIDQYSFNVSSNGFIFFGTPPIVPIETTYKPTVLIAWNTLSPFGGKLSTTNNGVEIEQNNIQCKITFECYSNQNSSDRSNILKFGIIIYFDTDTVDFFYDSCTSRSTGFSNDVYIGSCTGSGYKSEFRYISNTDNMTFYNGNGQVDSENKFPAVGTIQNISNISISDTKILPNAKNGHTVGIPIGGTFNFNDHDGTIVPFNSCSINSDGTILFGEYSDGEINPYGYAYYKILIPFCGKFKITDDGITINRGLTTCNITFNCYPTYTATTVLKFHVILYYNTSRVDYEYKNVVDKTTDFLGDYFIGFTNRNTFACVQNVDNENTLNYFIPGGSPIVPTEGEGVINFPLCYYPPTCTVQNVLSKDLLNVNRYLCTFDDVLLQNIPLAGTFVFGESNYTTCNISSNGYIYFDNLNIQNDNTINSGKLIAPFMGDQRLTVKGINFDRRPTYKKCIIKFDAYGYYDASNNIIKYEIILYFSDHPIRPNHIDFHYISAQQYTQPYFASPRICTYDGIKLINITSSYNNLMEPLYPPISSIYSTSGSVSNQINELIPNVLPNDASLYAMNLSDDVLAIKECVKLVNDASLRNVASLNIDDEFWYDDTYKMHGKIIGVNPKMLPIFFKVFDSRFNSEEIKKNKLNIFLRTFITKRQYVL